MDYVAYYRVSTKEQGKSGLGLEAQEAAVNNYLKSDDSIIGAFQDIASGKKNDRTQLKAAIDYSKKNNATLLIAKLDRLSRNVAFIFELKDSGVNFVCADMPDANTLTIGIFASMAQHERELISKRTKAALAARKARGFKLGTPANITDEGRAKGRAVLIERAKNNENNIRAMELIKMCKAQGMTLAAIAEKLNSNGYKTARGKKFQKTTVTRLWKRSLAAV